MEKLIFSICDKDITRDAKTPTISRENPKHLPCGSCGSTSRRLDAGKVPGSASLRCSCNKFIKWLTPGEVAKLEARLGGQV
jgi:hypothetical protein